MFQQATKSAAGGMKGNAPLLDPGAYPARLVQIIDIGMQPGSKMYPEPKLKMEMRFECLDEFLLDDEGKEIPDQPRFFSMELTYNADGYMGDRSNIYKVFEALDGFEKPIRDLLGKACNITLGKKLKADGKTEKNVILSVSAMREKDLAKQPENQSELLFLSLYDPDMEVWNKLPKGDSKWTLRNKIKSSLELRLTPMFSALIEAGEINEEDYDEPETDEQSSEEDGSVESAESESTESQEPTEQSGGGEVDPDEEDPFA